MAANTQPIFPLTPKNPSVAIANADAQAVKTVVTAGAAGTRVGKLVLVSTDIVPRDVGIFINGVLIGTVAVPAGAGNSSTVPPVDVLASANIASSYYDANGNKVIDIAATLVLGINAPVTLTAAKTITGIATAADF